MNWINNLLILFLTITIYHSAIKKSSQLTDFYWWVKVLCFIVILIPSLVLIGWQFNIETLKRIIPGMVAMNPMTAVAFICASTSLLLQTFYPRKHILNIFGLLLTCIVFYIGFSKLAEIWWKWNIAVDRLLFDERLALNSAQPNRMAPNTAFNFVLFGFALFFLDVKIVFNYIFSHFLVGVSLLFSGLAIVGYLYNIVNLYGVPTYVPMALHTAITFFILAFALLLARTKTGLMFHVVKMLKNTSLNKKINSGLILGLLILVFVGYISYRNTQKLISDANEVARTIAVREATQELLASLIDAETGQRGYIITGDQEFLEPYFSAVRNYQGRIEKLNNLSKDNQVKTLIKEIDTLTEQRFARLEQGINLRRTKNFDEARKFIATKQGKAIMDTIRGKIAEIDVRENVLLKERSAIATQTQQNTITTIIVGTASAFFVVLLAIYLTNKDLNYKKKIEDALKAKNEQYDFLTKGTNDVIWDWDLNTNTITWNDNIFSLFGYKEKDIDTNAEWWVSHIHPEDREEIVKTIDSAIAGKSEFWSGEYRFKKHDEKYTFIVDRGFILRDDKGKGIRMVGSMMDVTARKLAEQKVEQERAKDEALLQSIGDGVVATDHKGNLILMNEAAENLLGIEKKDVIGKKYYDVWSVVDAKNNPVALKNRPIYQALETQKRIISSDLYYVNSKEEKIPVSVTVSPVIIRKKLMGVIDVFRNISKEKEVDRMKTEFISLASHQLRTPLSAMRWFSEMLLAGDAGKLNKEQSQFVQNISDSNDRMIDLVNSLLNISRIESGRLIIDPKPTDLHTLVKEVLGELEQRIKKKKIQMIVSVNDELPLISIDPDLIRQVYLNLLTNAIKYTPEQGEITIFISRKDNNIISQVSDTGYGIPAKDQDKVFQKFYRGHNIVKIETDGNGLGLYLIKAIVDSSGGKIWFKSEEGKGTSFWFSLPMAGSKPNQGEVHLDT